MTKPRRRCERAVSRLWGVVITAAVLLSACSLTPVPRSVGAGELVITGFPHSILTAGELAEFVVRTTLPPGEYVIRVEPDAAGVEADSGVMPESAGGLAFRVNGDGTIGIGATSALREDVVVGGRLVGDRGPAAGVARSWAIAVDVIDPYTTTRQKLIEAVFPYRVQWTD